MNRSDNFNRPDNPSSLGEASDTLGPWTAHLDTWGINNNAAIAASGAVFGSATLESGAADAEAQFTYRGSSTAANIGPAVRVTDGNNGIYVYNYSGAFYMAKNVAGGLVVIGPPGGVAGATADGSVLKLRCQGDQISFYLDGALLIGPVTETHNQTATRHGLFNGGLYGAGGDRFDDFSITDLAGGGGGDTTPPTLTSPIGIATGGTTATVGATTSEGNGTIYAVVTAGGTAPSAARVKAGQDSAGAAAAWAGSLAISSTGAKTLNATGLAASTSYYVHLMHEDAAGNQSAVVSSAQFTTSAGDLTVLVSDGNWFFSPYNWLRNGSTYNQTTCPGAYFRRTFSGTFVRLKVDVSPLTAAGEAAGNYPAILYSVDGARFTRYQLTAADATVSLATGLSAGMHTLEVHLAGSYFASDRWTTPVMVFRVTGLEVEAGSTSSAPALRPNRVLFFGDSNAEGYEALGDGADVAHQDAVQAFPALLGWAFDAEYGVVGYASQGYVTGGGGNVPPLSSAWDDHYNGVSRLAGGLFSPAPHWIFCHHGQNDGSDVTATVTGLVAAWRAAAGPSARLIFSAGWGGSRYAEIAAGVAASGDIRAHAINPSSGLVVGIHGTTYHLRADYGHPRYATAVAGLARAAATLPGAGVSLIGGGLIL